MHMTILIYIWRLRGATVARLTPDQKAVCSNHVGVKLFYSFLTIVKFKENFDEDEILTHAGRAPLD